MWLQGTDFPGLLCCWHIAVTLGTGGICQEPAPVTCTRVLPRSSDPICPLDRDYIPWKHSKTKVYKTLINWVSNNCYLIEIIFEISNLKIIKLKRQSPCDCLRQCPFPQILLLPPSTQWPLLAWGHRPQKDVSTFHPGLMLLCVGGENVGRFPFSYCWLCTAIPPNQRKHSIRRIGPHPGPYAVTATKNDT